jgi:hypothetical protein
MDEEEKGGGTGGDDDATSFSVAMMEEDKHAANNDEDAVAGSVPSLPAWTVRDAAYNFTGRSLQVVEESNGAQQQQPTGPAAAEAADSTDNMVLSAVFDSEGVVQHIRIEKAFTVIQALEAGASAVLQAALEHDTQLQQQQNAASSSRIKTKISKDGTEEDWEQNLPASLLLLPKNHQNDMDRLRQISMGRSYENKEYAKRKGGKTDPIIMVAQPRQKNTTQPQLSKKAVDALLKKKPPTTTTDRTAAAAADAVVSSSSIPTKTKTAISSSSTPRPIPAVVSKSEPATLARDEQAEQKPSTAGASSSACVADPSEQQQPPMATTIVTSPIKPKSSSTTKVRIAPSSRNTPASSPMAMESRCNATRAVLCAAANAVFLGLGSDSNKAGKERDDDDDLDDTTRSNVPQQGEVENMSAVLVEARKLAGRIQNVTRNAIARSDLRYQYRQDNFRANPVPAVTNPFTFGATLVSDDSDDGDDNNSNPNQEVEESHSPYDPNTAALTDFWNRHCLERCDRISQTVSGHVLYHDVQWSTRHGRLADLLHRQQQRTDGRCSGLHLILTTRPQIPAYAREFHRYSVLNSGKDPTAPLRAAVYSGSRTNRRKVRKHFASAAGLPRDPFHVVIVSYATFLQDYIHFCQVPFHTVIVDEGSSWMAAIKDASSPLGTIWEEGIFSLNDNHVGFAGAPGWDFTVKSLAEIPEAALKNACLGLTARHRILTVPELSLKHRRKSTELLSIPNLLQVVAPQFASIVKEDWDRCKMTGDSACMNHFRNLLARTMVVHDEENLESLSPDALSLQALGAKIPAPMLGYDPPVPRKYTDEEFVTCGKATFSKRYQLQWLGPDSWLRYELGSVDINPILEVMKGSNNHGHVCEEITPASSLTATGATGHVTGTMGYRLAVRCGRYFGSEAGLRQHIATHHAPAGTWLCRACSIDCVTSHSRTHHERTCGQSVDEDEDEPNGSVGATPTVGQGKKKPGPKKKGGRPSTKVKAENEKDLDGSMLVPTYRGVWQNKAGKYFVKLDGIRLTDSDHGNKLFLYDTVDEAAQKHDNVVKARKKGTRLELNFKPDGSRVLYEENASAPPSAVRGNTNAVVPALSVINIRDLPSDVKPLLRDPRQTSRTGGNSKRHVYAYRGVCRQARKGHDRWQSQISFMGVNHYLGTFDSEWDAAAVYAWAHLILYGEEATKQAQKEGEEAAAAYEKEKKDIAEGRMPAASPKPEKKKKPKAKKEKKRLAEKKVKYTTTKTKKAPEGAKTKISSTSSSKKRSRPSASPASADAVKRQRVTKAKMPKTEKEDMIVTLSKAVTKVPFLAPKEMIENHSEADLVAMMATKVKAARDSYYCASVSSLGPSSATSDLRPCLPKRPPRSLPGVPLGGALLLGLSPSMFEWDLKDFVESRRLKSEQEKMAALQLLAVEYDEDGVNEKFGSLMQGTTCIIGSASKETQAMYSALGLGTVPLGGTVGSVDCHIGGVPGSCSERAACIRFVPTKTSEFQFSCLSEGDIVTLNGRQIKPESGAFPLQHEDVCSVGARVFVFVLPREKLEKDVIGS